jgi:cyclopropane-fatty-acyl-phospholipid synthase
MAWIFKRLMDRILTGAIHQGQFRVIWPDRSETQYGNGQGLRAGMQIFNNATLRRLVANPGLAIGEAYMDEGMVPIDCSIHDVLVLLLDNIRGRRIPVLAWNERLGRLLRPILQANNATRSKHNVAHHYDLNGRLYSLFLDRDRQYSCAYFPRGDETLEEA